MNRLSSIKVLIVDDSVTFCKVLEMELSNDLNIQVVGTAVNALDAMEKIQQLHPDVVTLDVEMPRMNGIEFLKTLLPLYPVPVVVVSSLPIHALDALHAGAVDFVRKPMVKGPFDRNDFISDLTVKIKVASKARVAKPQGVRALPFAGLALSGEASDNTVIAIGASTGGTEAILSVVRDLPESTPGIVVVQHMPPVFTNMYTQRLDKLCKMQVKEAVDGERLYRGKIIIAAGDSHLQLAKDSMGYYVTSAPGPRVSGHCPSVDVLFHSVAAAAGPSALGIILTGMGADGAKGIAQMRRSGAYTIGQDQESCVVYGMPMEAYKLGGIAKQLPLDQIQDEIIRYLNTANR